MTVFSVWGTVSALGPSPHAAQAFAAWLLAAAALVALVAPWRAGGTYDAAQRTFSLPGTMVPLLLIVALFLVKYVVGVELAIAPRLLQDPAYVLTVAVLYGAFTGLFVGRTARLWRLVWRTAPVAAA